MAQFSADIILVFHFCVVVFIASGFFLVPIGYSFHWDWIGNRRLRTVHVGLMAFVTVETLLGMNCPLTTMEFSLRGGHQPNSFVGYWIQQIVFWDAPAIFFISLYLSLLGWTLLMWIIFPPKESN